MAPEDLLQRVLEIDERKNKWPLITLLTPTLAKGFCSGEFRKSEVSAPQSCPLQHERLPRTPRLAL